MDQEKSCELIKLYEKHSILWNAKNKQYRNRNKREDAWREISSLLNTPVATLKSKIKTLMGTCRSEKSREKKSRITGSGSEDVYISKWFAFKQFDILSDKDNPSETMDTLNEESQDNDGNDLTVYVSPASNASSSTLTTDLSAPPDPSSSGTTTQVPITSNGQVNQRKCGKKRKRNDEHGELHILDEAMKVFQSSNELTTDPYYSYGQHLANELRKYDPQTLAYVERAIADVLFEADIGTIFQRYRTPSYECASLRTSFPQHDATPSPPLLQDPANNDIDVSVLQHL